MREARSAGLSFSSGDLAD
jgi:hypothetical protein